MDISGTITYNGWTATTPVAVAGGGPRDGVIIERADISPVEVAQYLDKRAASDGLDVADVYLGGRRMTISAAVLGSTTGRLWDNLDDLLAAFNPVLAYNADSARFGFVALDYYRPTADISTWPTSTYPSGIPLRLYARPLQPPRWDVRRIQATGRSSLGAAIRVQIELLAKDPRQYLQTQQSLSMSTSTATATYRGNYPSFPIITFALTASGSTAATKFNIGSEYVPIIMSNYTTGTYTIDFETRRVNDSAGSADLSGLDTSDTISFPEIQSGSTYFISGATTGLGAVTLAYTEAWV
jgi:hypothetical protein